MRTNGRIIKGELKERVEEGAHGPITESCVVVTVETETNGFKMKSQVYVDVAEQEHWQLGGTASVDVQVKQMELLNSR